MSPFKHECRLFFATHLYMEFCEFFNNRCPPFTFSLTSSVFSLNVFFVFVNDVWSLKTVCVLEKSQVSLVVDVQVEYFTIFIEFSIRLSVLRDSSCARVCSFFCDNQWRIISEISDLHTSPLVQPCFGHDISQWCRHCRFRADCGHLAVNCNSASRQCLQHKSWNLFCTQLLPWPTITEVAGNRMHCVISTCYRSSFRLFWLLDIYYVTTNKVY